MNISMIEGTGSDLPVIMILTGREEERENLWPQLERLKDQAAFALVSDIDWNRDLSPWRAPAAWKHTPDFSGGADAFLQEILDAGLCLVREAIQDDPAWYGIAGYSMAGLFAVYSLYRTDVFARVVSASGSLWYDEFREYAVQHAFYGKPERIYLSLGDKERRTRNLRVAKVEDDTRALSDCYKERGIETIFELNPGNHFQDPEGRLLKGIRWILKDKR